LRGELRSRALAAARRQGAQTDALTTTISGLD
jgi:hypothetical protein